MCSQIDLIKMDILSQTFVLGIMQVQGFYSNVIHTLPDLLSLYQLEKLTFPPFLAGEVESSVDRRYRQ